MAYKFSLIRFVPDPARGEFVNIGAVAGDEDSDDWEVRWIANYARARALDNSDLLPAAKAFTATIDAAIADIDQPTLDGQRADMAWLKSLAADMNNIVQVSDPAPVVAESAELALDMIFERLLVDPSRVQQRFRKKHQAQAATRRAFRASHVPDDAVKQHARVDSGPYTFDFDFAVHNGHAVQLVQCWSFELPNQTELTDQVKSWAWMAHMIREHGGLLSANGVDVPGDLDLAAVYIPPVHADSHAFREAESAFAALGVTAAQFDDVAPIGDVAAAALGVAA